MLNKDSHKDFTTISSLVHPLSICIYGGSFGSSFAMIILRFLFEDRRVFNLLGFRGLLMRKV